MSIFETAVQTNVVTHLLNPQAFSEHGPHMASGVRISGAQRGVRISGEQAGVRISSALHAARGAAAMTSQGLQRRV